MARTSIALQTAALNAGTVITETIAAAGATGTAGYAITSLERDTDATLVIRNPGATGVFTIKAGEYQNASQGDLDVVVGGGGTISAIQLDGERFRTSDGKYNLDTQGVTGIIYAVQK